MSFARHRTQQKADTTSLAPVVKIEKEKTPDIKTEPIVPGDHAELGKLSISANTDNKVEAAEEILKSPEITRKKREDKKVYTNIGIIGDTVECRDFRAIVKKRGEQINNVLTTILHKWNTENYNL